MMSKFFSFFSLFASFFAFFRRIINGRKLRKLCNIFIKFSAVACNFYDGEEEKVFSAWRLRARRKANWRKIKENSPPAGGVEVYEAWINYRRCSLVPFPLTRVLIWSQGRFLSELTALGFGGRGRPEPDKWATRVELQGTRKLCRITRRTLTLAPINFVIILAHRTMNKTMAEGEGSLIYKSSGDARDRKSRTRYQIKAERANWI